MIYKKHIVRAFCFSLFLLLSACAHLDMDEPIILDSDLAFGFGSAELTEAGKKQIDMYVPSLAYRNKIQLEIVGHSDRIGNPTANQKLSERRAQAVADRLLLSGKLDRDIIRVRGLGSKDPVVHCDQKSKQALIDCLAPNRRVEIRVIDVFH